MKSRSANLARTVMTLFVLVLTLFVMPTSSHAASQLGVRVSVVPEKNPQANQLYTDNNKLWFVATKNGLMKRTIWIQETVGSDQRINLLIGAAKNVNGKVTYDSANKSNVAAWVKFSENDFILSAKSQKKIDISLTPSSGLKDYQQDAILLVTTSSSKPNTPSKSKAPIKVIIPVNFAYAVPLFLGFGDLKNLVSFKITDFNGYSDSEGKFLEMKIKNDGLSLIEPNGRAQLKFVDFESTKLGPYVFKVVQIRPKSDGLLIARVPDTVLPGKYESLVEAQFGSFADAKIFTKKLEFKPKSNFGLLNILLMSIGLLLLFFSIRHGQKLKAKNSKVINQSKTSSKLNKFAKQLLVNANKGDMRKRSFRNQDSNHKNEIDEDLEIWLEDLLKKTTAKKTTAKKTTAKKTTAKKTTAKNSK